MLEAWKHMSSLTLLRAADVMTKHVVTARPNDGISKVAAQMERHDIGSVVIVQNRRVVGILTERDFSRIVKQGITEGRSLAKHHMNKPVVTVRSDARLSDVVKLMRKKHVRHLPVVDRHRRPLGMISSRDLMNIASDLIL
jgi:CBS domain-containing protein